MIDKEKIPVDDKSVLRALLILQNAVNNHLPAECTLHGMKLKQIAEYLTVPADLTMSVQ